MTFKENQNGFYFSKDNKISLLKCKMFNVFFEALSRREKVKKPSRNTRATDFMNHCRYKALITR